MSTSATTKEAVQPKDTFDIKSELMDIQKQFMDKANEYREKYFVNGKGLILLNFSKEDKIEIGFAINQSNLKPIS